MTNDEKLDSKPSLKRDFDSFHKGSHIVNSVRICKLRKCSYILAVIKAELFVKYGAKQIAKGIYIMEKIYNDTVYGETCAIIGLHKNLVRQLLDKNSDIYTFMRQLDILKNIPGIENLSPYRLYVLKCMLKYLYFVYNDEIILFNIEPKGNKPIEHIYPCANICLPGGGIEKNDGKCWEKCARREFSEEVGLMIPENGSTDISLITKQKFTFMDRQSMYFMWRIRKFL